MAVGDGRRTVRAVPTVRGARRDGARHQTYELRVRGPAVPPRSLRRDLRTPGGVHRPRRRTCPPPSVGGHASAAPVGHAGATPARRSAPRPRPPAPAASRPVRDRAAIGRQPSQRRSRRRIRDWSSTPPLRGPRAADRSTHGRTHAPDVGEARRSGRARRAGVQRRSRSWSWNGSMSHLRWSRLGGHVELGAELRSVATERQRLVVDFVVHHVNASGATSPKVFKWTTVDLGPDTAMCPHQTARHPAGVDADVPCRLTSRRAPGRRPGRRSSSVRRPPVTSLHGNTVAGMLLFPHDEVTSAIPTARSSSVGSAPLAQRPPRRPTVTAAEEKAQAREVSLRRIARLFAPHRRSARRRHRASSSCRPSSSMASPFLLRAVIDVALPAAGPDAAGLAGRRHGRRRRRDLRARRRPDLDLHRRSASGSCTGCAPTSSRTCSGSRSAFFTRTRTGEVQSRITNDIGGMQSVVTSTATSVASNLTTAVATAVAMVALSLAAHAGLAGRAAAGDLADPPGRPDAPRDHRAQQRELADLNVTVDEAPVDQRRAARPARSAPARRWSSGSPRRRPA